jgi:teichuronic acid biosynthesis glycosyltransferase TuaG
MPRLSIVTPAYNAVATLPETAISVREQGFTDWEWHIADDASKDTTAEMLRGLAAADPRIKPVFMAKNGGPAVARQAALAEAKGDYIAFLDADDVWLPGKLEKQLAFMAEKKAALTYTGYRRLAEDGGKTGDYIHVPPSLDYGQLLKNTAIACSTAIVDRRMAGDFAVKNEPYHDFTTWLDILGRGFTAHGLDEDLMRYRIREGSDSSNKIKGIKRVWHIYRKVEKLPLPYAAFCLAGYGLNASLKRVRY